MGRFIDLTGQVFGNWKVIEFVGTRKISSNASAAYWLCECQCEAKTRRVIPSNSLRTGNSKSCGCLKIKALVERSTKHGFARRGKNGSSIYHVWREMCGRCFNPSCKSYHNYGGRGITVCDEWKDDFVAFKDWAFANGYEIGLSIDRINNDGNYEPDNCRWTDVKTQANNTRGCHIVEIDGVKKNISQWCEIYKISPSIVYSRIDVYKWDPVKAIMTPLKKRGSRKKKPVIAIDEYGNRHDYESAYEASVDLGICISSVRRACREQDNNYRGYSWRYEEESKESA